MAIHLLTRGAKATAMLKAGYAIVFLTALTQTSTAGMIGVGSATDPGLGTFDAQFPDANDEDKIA